MVSCRLQILGMGQGNRYVAYRTCWEAQSVYIWSFPLVFGKVSGSSPGFAAVVFFLLVTTEGPENVKPRDWSRNGT